MLTYQSVEGFLSLIGLLLSLGMRRLLLRVFLHHAISHLRKSRPELTNDMSFDLKHPLMGDRISVLVHVVEHLRERLLNEGIIL